VTETPPRPDWSASGGPDVFTLRAWLSVERAAGRVDGLDTAVAFLQDRVHHIFGGDVLPRYSEFIAARGLDDVAANRLVDDDAALRALLDHLLASHESPGPPDEDIAWTAFEPGRMRRRWRRAVRNRHRTAALAQALPPRRRVAGRTSRDA
jgi:hypothetical protein